MKNPRYRPLYRNSYAKELGRLAQGMPGLADGEAGAIWICLLWPVVDNYVAVGDIAPAVDGGMKKMVLVPSASPGIPWARRPSSLAYELR